MQTVVTVGEQSRTVPTVDALVDERNAEISRKQVAGFKTAKPGDRDFAYMSNDETTVTTWTGEAIGTIHRLHKTQAGFGGHRYYFRMRAYDGRIWIGNGLGAGMYCRLRLMKGDQ
jgi:hypothetical protein